MWGISDSLMSELQRIYKDIRNPMRLGELEISTRLMLTDRFIEPNNGVALKFSYGVAGKALASHVNFHKFEPSITFYWRMVSWLQLAIRTEAGFVLPYGGTEFIGLQDTFYLGGYNSMRGWGGKKLAPWENICFQDGDCEQIHVGGNTLVLGNVEFRFKANRFISIVTFLDVGDVQKETLKIVPAAWNYSVGSGLRVHTPIGLFRVDFGVRVNDPEMYSSERRWGLHIGLGEAF
jgi:outer membrane protein assembly factor BamA